MDFPRTENTDLFRR